MAVFSYTIIDEAADMMPQTEELMATATKAKEPGTGGVANLLQIFERQLLPDLANTIQAQERTDEEARMYTQRALQMKAESRRLIERVKEMREMAKEKMPIIEEKAQTLTQMLARHAGVLKFSATKKGEIVITTNLLFTDIREQDGSRTYHRTCIGAYQITIGRNVLRVKNLVFTHPREHWSLQGDNPCLGEWRDIFGNLLGRYDWYGIFDTMFHYLRSTDDSGAYMRSHHWKAERNLRGLASVKGEGIEVGAYVINTALSSDSKALQGMVGKVVYVNTSSQSASVEYREEFADGHTGDNGSGLDHHCWNAPLEHLSIITKEIYDGKTRYKIARTNVADAMAQIDELPDGSTINDARAIARAAFSGRIKIELSDLE